MVELRNAGIVASQRGAEGGYWLARPRRPVTWQTSCARSRARSPPSAARGPRPVQYQGSARALRDVWIAVRQSLRIVLETVTVAQLAAGDLPDEILAMVREPEAWTSH